MLLLDPFNKSQCLKLYRMMAFSNVNYYCVRTEFCSTLPESHRNEIYAKYGTAFHLHDHTEI